MVSEQPWPASWAKTSSSRVLHLYAWGAVEKVQSLVRWNAAQVISNSGELGERRGGKCGCFLGRQCASENACVCVSIQCMWRLARWNIRLTAIIHVYHCSASHSFLFVPSSRDCFHSVWSAAEPCGVLLLTNQTSQCHWAALSKTHGHVSSLHSLAFQRLAGSRAKEL